MWSDEWHVLLVCLFVCVPSLGANLIGDGGVSTIGAGLHGVPSLTSLKYVIQSCVMCWCEEDRQSGVMGSVFQVGVVRRGV